MNRRLVKLFGKPISLVVLLAFAGLPVAADSVADNLQAAPAAVKLRTIALLLSEQQGGELSMVASLIRRPPADQPETESAGPVEVRVVTEVAGSSLGEALTASGEVEAYAYLLDPRAEVLDSATAVWNPPVEDGSTPSVRFHVSFSVEQPGQYRVRLLVRAGEQFGLRTLPLEIPAVKAPGAKLWEPRIQRTADSSWRRVSPAGRGLNDPQAALTVLARGAEMSWTSPISGEPGALEVELVRGDQSRRLEPAAFDPATGHGSVQLPADLTPGRYQLRLVSELAPASLSVPVMVVDERQADRQWTEVTFAETEVDSFTGVAVEMPKSEGQRILATRRELVQVLIDSEESFGAAGARLRALEDTLKESLQEESNQFLERQMDRVAGLLARRTLHRPEVSLALAWLLLKHSAYHQRQGSHQAFRLTLDQAMKVLDTVAKSGAEGRRAASDALAIVAGRLQRKGRVNASEEMLRRSLRYDSESTLAMSALAAICERQGRAEEAVPLLRRRLELDSKDLATRLRLAVALQRSEQPAAAARQLDRVLKGSTPGSDLRLLAHQQKVRLRADQNKPSAAGKALEAGLADFPNDPTLVVARHWLDSLRRPGAGLAATAPAPAGDRENPRHRFGAWPRAELDQAADRLRVRAEASAPLLAAAARGLLSELEQ